MILDFLQKSEANSPKNRSKIWQQAKLCTVQVGIEALSATLLSKMNKGTRVIDNIAIMKYCMEFNIALEANIIIDFPGSTAKEIEETLDNLDYVMPYHPLTSASFFLGTGSPMWKSPHMYAIKAKTVRQELTQLFPSDIASTLDFLIQGYRGDRTRQKKKWSPVAKKITRWQSFHKNRKETSPPLLQRDGGSFLIIRQEKIDTTIHLHRLYGTSRKIYLFCSTPQSLQAICSAFPDISEKSLLNFFDDLSKKQLLFQENNTFLALAISTDKQMN